MLGSEVSGKQITEQLGGRPSSPLSHQERVERERIRDLIQTVASCYQTLLSREADADRRAGLVAKLAFYDAEFGRRDTMTAEQRRAILETYPEVLLRLRAQVGT